MTASKIKYGFIKKLFACWFGFHVFWIFLVLYPFFLITLSTPKLYNVAHQLRRLWGFLLFVFGPIFIKRKGKEHIVKGETYVIISNHTSYLDIPSLSVCIPVNLNFIAKIELSKIPLFGIFFKTIDIPVDRKQARHGAIAYRRAVDQLKNKERSLVVFPEGGIPASAPKLSHFKDGPFKMAIEAGVPILPVALPDNYNRFPSDHFAGTPGKMRVIILEPIPTIGLTEADLPELKQKAFTAIELALHTDK